MKKTTKKPYIFELLLKFDLFIQSTPFIVFVLISIYAYFLNGGIFIQEAFPIMVWYAAIPCGAYQFTSQVFWLFFSKNKIKLLRLVNFLLGCLYLGVFVSFVIQDTYDDNAYLLLMIPIFYLAYYLITWFDFIYSSRKLKEEKNFTL